MKDNYYNQIMDILSSGIIIYKEGNNYLLHYSTDSNIFATKYLTI